MTDIYLYAGEASPNDVILSDPTVLRGGATVTGAAALTGASSLTAAGTVTSRARPAMVMLTVRRPARVRGTATLTATSSLTCTGTVTTPDPLDDELARFLREADDLAAISHLLTPA